MGYIVWDRSRAFVISLILLRFVYYWYQNVLIIMMPIYTNGLLQHSGKSSMLALVL